MGAHPHPGLETAHRFFSGTGPSYDLIALLCTAGVDLYWKKRILDKIPPLPRHVIEPGAPATTPQRHRQGRWFRGRRWVAPDPTVLRWALEDLNL